MHSMMEDGIANGSARLNDMLLIEKPFHGQEKAALHDADTWFLSLQRSCHLRSSDRAFLKDNDAIYPGAFSRDIAMPVWTLR
jgi:hypothetical protein